MYKLIDSSSFFDQEDLQVTILNTPGCTDSLIKVAADERVQSFVTDGLRVEPGKMYLHINAMGAGEYYGPNRNGDYFPEDTLKKYYKTFETSPAHVFRHHINKDPAKAIGKVIFALYNERMHRVELIAEVDRDLGSDVEQRIAQGDFPATSMACKTPYDVCSICGNKAHTRQEYCIHLKQHLGRVMPDGKRVMAINEAPLRFFDISIVIKPADITSSILQKVANTEPAISSALLAEEEGVELNQDREKFASLRKVSELIKEIDGYVQGVDSSMERILSQIKDPEIDSVKKLDSVPLEDLFQTFGELGISPSLKFLAEVIAHRMGKHHPGIGDAVVDALRKSNLDKLPMPAVEMDSDREAPALVKQAFSHCLESSSIFPSFIEKRAYQGYAGQGPRILPTEEEIRSDERRRVQAEGSKFNPSEHPFLTLLTIGGAALWAKAYINSIIEKKLSELHVRNAPTIVKIASTSAAAELKSEYTNKPSIGLKVLSKAISAKGTPLNKEISLTLNTISTLNRKLSKDQRS